jgi:hypothetical protein
LATPRTSAIARMPANRNITASTAEGRPITTRMPEIVETSQQQY